MIIRFNRFLNIFFFFTDLDEADKTYQDYSGNYSVTGKSLDFASTMNFVNDFIHDYPICITLIFILQDFK